MIRPLTPKPNHNKGFSMGEVLISLIILATLAIYTIPKIITNSQNNYRRALFKETISTLSELTYQGKLTGELTNTNCASYFINKINTVKSCPTNSLAQGCYANVMAGEQVEPGFIMPNGAFVGGLIENCAGLNIGFIDIDGSSRGTGTAGVDIMFIEIVGNGTPAINQKKWTVYGCSPATCGSPFYTTMFEDLWR